MGRHGWIALAAALLVLGTASAALARPFGPPPADRLFPVGPRLQQALGLSEEQVRRLEAVWQTYRSRAARLRLDLARARLDLREAMLAERPDQARVDQIARRIGDLTAQLVSARAAFAAEVRAILTPEQQARLRALTHRRARPGWWWGR